MILFAFCRWGSKLGFEFASSQAKSGVPHITLAMFLLFYLENLKKEAAWRLLTPVAEEWWRGAEPRVPQPFPDREGPGSEGGGARLQGGGTRLRGGGSRLWRQHGGSLGIFPSQVWPSPCGVPFTLGASWVSACSAGAWPQETSSASSAGDSLPSPLPPAHPHRQEWRAWVRKGVFQTELPEGLGSEHGRRQRSGFQVLVLTVFSQWWNLSKPQFPNSRIKTQPPTSWGGWQVKQDDEQVPEKCLLGFSGGSVVKNSPANPGDGGLIPGLGRSPKEGNMATHSSILAWEIPGTEEPGRLQSMGLWKSWNRLSDWKTRAMPLIRDTGLQDQVDLASHTKWVNARVNPGLLRDLL